MKLFETVKDAVFLGKFYLAYHHIKLWLYINAYQPQYYHWYYNCCHNKNDCIELYTEFSIYFLRLQITVQWESIKGEVNKCLSFCFVKEKVELDYWLPKHQLFFLYQYRLQRRHVAIIKSGKILAQEIRFLSRNKVLIYIYVYAWWLKWIFWEQ